MLIEKEQRLMKVSELTYENNSTKVALCTKTGIKDYCAPIKKVENKRKIVPPF